MTGKEEWPIWISWTLVLFANIIVPLPLGLAVTENGGRFGIGCAIIAWWVLGLAACRRYAPLMRSLIAGGIVVGLSQFLPVPQVAAGFAAIGFWSRFGGIAVERSKELAAFGITALTGGELLALAYVFGLLVRAAARLGQDLPAVASQVERAQAPAESEA